MDAQESSQIALLVARRQLQSRKQSGFFEAGDVKGAWLQPQMGCDCQLHRQEHELFLHCPEGATPKDGPSAAWAETADAFQLWVGQIREILRECMFDPNNIHVSSSYLDKTATISKQIHMMHHIDMVFPSLGNIEQKVRLTFMT